MLFLEYICDVNIMNALKTMILQLKLQEIYIQEQLPGFLANFEKILKENHGGDGFFVGDQVHFIQLHLNYSKHTIFPLNVLYFSLITHYALNDM